VTTHYTTLRNLKSSLVTFSLLFAAVAVLIGRGQMLTNPLLELLDQAFAYAMFGSSDPTVKSASVLATALSW
jgi:hypothetical protein